VTNLYAIVVNYFTCFLVGSLVNGELPLSREMVHTTWFPYAVFLSFTFILFFNVNAFTIQKVGMVITSVFQKLSLVFPVLVGLLFFGEASDAVKLFAIVLTVIAIVLINLPHKKSDADNSEVRKYWYWPIIVLLGSGLIESTLFYVQETGKVVDAGVAFVTILFFLAGCWGSIFILLTGALAKIKLRDVIAGVLIGIPNFFTIWLLIKGLELGYEGSVLFPLNNVGVIFFTALIGIFIFRERMSKFNYLGLALAIGAVYLISG